MVAFFLTKRKLLLANSLPMTTYFAIMRTCEQLHGRLKMEFTLDLVPATLSIVGALLVARYDRWSGLGWLLWIASNVMWIGWGLNGVGDGQIATGVIFQNTAFLATSIAGLRKWRKTIAHQKTT